MVGLASCCAVLVTALVAPPELPPQGPGVPDPAATEPGSPSETPTAEPEPEPQPPTPAEVQPLPEPAPQPDPQPEAQAQPPAEQVEHDIEAAPLHERRVRDRDRDEDDEIARFEPRLWGMQFTFGGLAPMSVGGVRDYDVNRLMFTELGFRRVLNNDWALLFSVGAGLFRHNPETGDTQNDVGLSASYGVQKWFRVWRRIAPFVGGRLRVSYAEPEGRANWNVGVGLGPSLGIEYFIGDRVSLSMQGDLQLGFRIFHALVQTELATHLDAGGQMGLTFYF